MGVNVIQYLSDNVKAMALPQFIFKKELQGLYGSTVLRELGELIGYYDVYESGAEFATEGSNGDYIPSQLRYKQINSMINKEARFLFSKSPDVTVNIDISGDMSEQQKQEIKAQQTALQTLVDKVLKENNFNSKLIKSAKDCFIGKRVALLVNVNESGCKVTFSPSLEFIFETDPDDVDILTKIVSFYTVEDNSERTQQRVYKKKLYMHEDGFCHVVEEVYDGAGNLVETLTEDNATRFTYIPAFVIINDGLTGDLSGVSEVAALMESESYYNRLANADQDAERKSMNPILYGIDLNPVTTNGLSTSPGSFWDLASDDAQSNERTGKVGMLESSMNYSGALSTTLDRIKNSMYEQMSMPNVSPEALKGVVSSGKTLEAIYWDLIVRCDEKMLVWAPALEGMVRTIIDGAKLYPEFFTRYTGGEPIPDVEYTVSVENQYSLPKNEQEEKATDLQEVQAQTMSRRAYMKKWRRLTDDQAEEELQQIAKEREMLEDSFTMPTTLLGTNEETNEQQTKQQTEQGAVQNL